MGRHVLIAPQLHHLLLLLFQEVVAGKSLVNLWLGYIHFLLFTQKPVEARIFAGGTFEKIRRFTLRWH